MAAKKPRDWRSGKREGRSRMVQMTRHLVVTEGMETEPRYFEGVRAALGAANEARHCSVLGASSHTIGGWVTLSHLRKTLQLRWAKFSM